MTQRNAGILPRERDDSLTENKYGILKDIFGHESFRPGQEEIVDALTAGRDVLAVMPTGGGKSVCYQIPALLRPGVTLVISPLISLMKDQVTALVQNGVRAAYLNSTLTAGQYVKALANMRNGVYKIVYVAPERLLTDGFLETVSALHISLVAVDEAHCVSGWGQDFRPAYLGIREFVDSLPKRPPVGAFTATATERVREDIADLLGLNDPFRIVTGFDRPNLYFEVIPVQKNDKDAALLKLIRERYEGQCGIVYCGTRNTVDEVTDMLNTRGIPSRGYHAGMSDEERHAAQEDFIYDRCLVMAATNAFGMGIDKSNVSFVIHYNMPKDVESYYQEAGRAGRDGEPADCVLLASKSDIVLNHFLIENGEPNPDLTAEEQERQKRLEYDRLDRMADYCVTPLCLRSYLLRYFGEETSGSCGNCSNCQGDFVVKDVTEDAQKVLSCMARTGNRWGAGTISAILRATSNETVDKYGLDSLSTYGIMKGESEQYIREIIAVLRAQGAVAYDADSVYRIPHATSASRDILLGRKKVYMKAAPENGKKKKKAQRHTADAADSTLLGHLKAERSRLAKELHVPPYVVFPDSALTDMCLRMPRDLDEFLEVSGVGKTKAAKYGEQFLAVIDKHRKD